MSEAAPTSASDRRALVVAAIGLCVLAALVLAVSLGPVDLVSLPPSTPAPPRSPAAPPSVQGFTPGRVSDRPADPTPGWASLLIDVLALLLGLVLLYLAYVLVRMTIRRLRGRRRRRTGVPLARSVAALPEVPEQLTGETAQRRRTALTTGEPRNAIVACWVDLEESAGLAGLPRLPAETPTEYVVRVLHTWDVDIRALSDLAGLFREARFSAHAVDESMRTRALADLDRIHADLAALAAAMAAATAAAAEAAAGNTAAGNAASTSPASAPGGRP